MPARGEHGAIWRTNSSRPEGETACCRAGCYAREEVKAAVE